MIRFDTGEVAALAADLDGLSRKTAPAMVKVFGDGADDLVKAWRTNSEQSSGPYSAPYRRALSQDRLVTTDIAYEVGPDASMPQGRMAWEYGDHNHPPHLDGQRAADEVIPRLERRVSATLSDLGL